MVFSWAHGTPEDAAIAFVRWCPIRISADGVTVGVLLRRPVVTDAIETREFLGNPQNNTYRFITDPRDFPEMAAEKIEGLTTALRLQLPHDGAPPLVLELRDESQLKIRLVADPQMKECKDVEGVPIDNNVVTVFTFQCANGSGMERTITVTQEALLRALGLTEKQRKELRKFRVPIGVSEINLPNNTLDGLANNFRSLVQLLDFSDWHPFSPFSKNPLQKHATGVREALGKFSKSMQDSKSSIPDSMPGEKADSPEKSARDKFEKIFTDVNPLIVKLEEQASEESVEAFEAELAKTRKWIESCMITATISATFEVEGAKPVTVTFLETASPVKGAAE